MDMGGYRMYTRNLIRTWGLLVLIVFVLTIFAPIASLASTVGKRNTAIGLTAGTVYAAVRGQKTAAIALGAGSVYAWKRHSDSRKNDAYKRGYKTGYKHGKYHKKYKHKKYYHRSACYKH